MGEPLTTVQAAPIIGVVPKTLENWRIQGKGPKFRKAGRKVVYDITDLIEFNNANRFSSTSEAGAA